MQLLNLVNVGAYLGVSKRTVRRLIGQNALPFYRVGRLIRIEKDPEEYLSTHKMEKLTWEMN